MSAAAPVAAGTLQPPPPLTQSPQPQPPTMNPQSGPIPGFISSDHLAGPLGFNPAITNGNHHNPATVNAQAQAQQLFRQRQLLAYQQQQLRPQQQQQQPQHHDQQQPLEQHHSHINQAHAPSQFPSIPSSRTTPTTTTTPMKMTPTLTANDIVTVPTPTATPSLPNISKSSGLNKR